MVEQNQFRQDLFYRINVIELRVPPLRERSADIPKLVARILNRLTQEHGSDKPRLEPGALQALLDYPFPGNVRELENVLERAVALCENGIITHSDLMLSPAPSSTTVQNYQVQRTGRDSSDAEAESAANGLTLDDLITTIERQKIMEALQQTRYNKTAAARKLGITFRALRYKLKKLGID